MVGALLLRGMLIGLLAGILNFGFFKLVGEPSVDQAIAFETRLEQATAHAAGDHAVAPEPELVSRTTQAGLGLFTGVAVYSAAFGGLFALAFALAHGRIGALRPRATAALVAGLGFAAVFVVPMLKYPANPPAVGEPDTIGTRTALYFSLIALSLAAMIAAGMLQGRLRQGLGGWNATLVAGAAYGTAIAIAMLLLPAVQEVPGGFPATVLWDFRIAALGGQAILWTTLGLGFGAAAERVFTGRRAAAGRAAAF